MARKQNLDQVLRRLPTKWAVGLVVLLVGYTLVQPVLTSRLGWSLPSLSDAVEQLNNSTSTNSASTNSASNELASNESASGTSTSNSASNVPLDDARAVDRDSSSRPTPAGRSAPRTASFSSDDELESNLLGLSPDGTRNSELLYDFLKPIGDDKFMSPAGLEYTRGSEEGHRILHVARHTKDQPNRSGKHGVFDGDIVSALRWIDDAYRRAKQNPPAATKRQDRGSTVIEARFSKPIGYIGGREGQRQGNPSANRVRLVVRGTRVITAFPY
jgi:hypothetical protein